MWRWKWAERWPRGELPLVARGSPAAAAAMAAVAPWWRCNGRVARPRPGRRDRGLHPPCSAVSAAPAARGQPCFGRGSHGDRHRRHCRLHRCRWPRRVMVPPSERPTCGATAAAGAIHSRPRTRPDPAEAEIPPQRRCPAPRGRRLRLERFDLTRPPVNDAFRAEIANGTLVEGNNDAGDKSVAEDACVRNKR